MFFVTHVVKQILKSQIMLIYLLKMINNMNLCIYHLKPRHHHLSRPLICSHIQIKSKSIFTVIFFVFYLLCNVYLHFLTGCQLIFFVQKANISTFHRVYSFLENYVQFISFAQFFFRFILPVLLNACQHKRIVKHFFSLVRYTTVEQQLFLFLFDKRYLNIVKKNQNTY